MIAEEKSIFKLKIFCQREKNSGSNLKAKIEGFEIFSLSLHR
jgi:hypothetical protein